ncbi:gliding motility lipoprotein GldB [Polaribacter sp. SA4-12]|uniref:gliding motility lipoprotein GldB n=1 Tax=Polaribacter sp. SA4-12 TaxID=1312072 RepID=UPI000B3D1608|nr:gliding motility lipoprotein GldB [Polaribacter sp. SA4-12]ARV16364.1 gliding motility lipoprotein GldB [Polaribacter sp. SA4-12]
MRFFIVVFLILLSFLSCKSDNKEVTDVSHIDVNFSIKRYEVDFYKGPKENLPSLKNKYPYLFPKSFSDSLAIAKMTDKEELDLFNETQKLYSDVSDLKSQLTSLFKHIKFYNPKFRSPNVTTMISNINYDSRVIYADSLLLISLDVYLGKEHKFYADYPKYIKENNTNENIIVDVANSITENQLLTQTNRSFIGKMIHEGKKMYLLDMYLPTISDKLKIGFSKEKLNWAITNEEEIWKYFIERKLLFSTDTKLNKRFLDNAPFSKFYLEDDNQSPGKIGVWLGWQIVRSYMQNNDVSLQELLIIDSEDLFKKSKYKPKK